MTRQQAVALVRERWCKERGHRPIARHIRKAPTKEQQEAARAELRLHRAAKPFPVNREWRQRETALQSVAICYPYEVGYEYVSDILGCPIRAIHGCGHSWEEAARAAKLLS